MKDADFKDLLKSIDEMRAIHAGIRQPSRVTRLDLKAPSFWRMIQQRRKEKSVSLEKLKRLTTDLHRTRRSRKS